MDTKNENNKQYVSEFITEIFEHLLETEHINVPVVDAMLNVQSEVNDSMRSLVVDWIIEVIILFINNFEKKSKTIKIIILFEYCIY